MATTTNLREKNGPATPNLEKKGPAAARSVDGKRGIDILHDPVLNKSTAYTEAERQALGLMGLVPDVNRDRRTCNSAAFCNNSGDKATDLDRYIYLVGLLDNNETLFYRVLMSDPTRFLPIVYDPTIAEACLKFGHIYRRPARHVPLDHPQGTREGRAAQLAGQGRARDLRDRRRPHPRPG